MVVYLFLLLNLFLSLKIIFYFKGYKKLSLLFKMLTSFTFLAVGAYGLSQTSVNEFHLIMFLGLILGAIGDFFLELIQKKNFLLYGIFFFLMGHLFYIIAFSFIIQFNIIEVLVFVSLLLLSLFTFKYFSFNFGKLKYPVYIYTIIISAMVSRAVSISLGDYSLTIKLLVILGSSLFVLSDYIINFTLFKKVPKIWIVVNLLTYYFGQFLLALLILYV